MYTKQIAICIWILMISVKENIFSTLVCSCLHKSYNPCTHFRGELIVVRNWTSVDLLNSFEVESSARGGSKTLEEIVAISTTSCKFSFVLVILLQNLTFSVFVWHQPHHPVSWRNGWTPHPWFSWLPLPICPMRNSDFTFGTQWNWGIRTTRLGKSRCCCLEHIGTSSIVGNAGNSVRHLLFCIIKIKMCQV